MKIYNFRAGFATNSSSSHSVILLEPNKIGKVKQINSANKNGFGWDFFRLVTAEDKLRYLAAQLFKNYASEAPAICDLVNKINQEVPGYADEVARQVNLITSSDKDMYFDTPYVDHQSVFSLPSNYDPEFVDALIEYFRSPKVAVLGGNDNDDRVTNKVAKSKPVKIFDKIKDCGYKTVIARRDGDIWVLFNKESGDKIRFSFDSENLEINNYAKSYAPELVDVKITNWCDRGCNFCYQASTTKGIHAPLNRIHEIAVMLHKMKVFEVAIGGGEPTAHPEFATILQIFNDYDIVPNFTTFSDNWLNNRPVVEAIKKYAGGIGVSCLSVNDFTLYNKISEALPNWNYHNKIMIQHVVGSVPYHKTIDIIKMASEKYVPILLLGYKNVGFGADYKNFDDGSFVNHLKRAIDEIDRGYIRLSVDTALINQYPNLPKIVGSIDALATNREGAFSCYIDATTNKCGASSYVPKNTMVDMPDNVEDFVKLYADF